MGMKTYLDWSAYDTYGVGDACAGIPPPGQLRQGGGRVHEQPPVPARRQRVMCPSYRITHDPMHSTGARVKAFKAALNGELGDEPFAHRISPPRWICTCPARAARRNVPARWT